MIQQIKDLELFQKAFNSTYNSTPTLLSENDWKLRFELSHEELLEYKTACEKKDIVGVFDSILDRLFLIFGDAVSHGLQDKLVDGFNEVLASNMSKLDKEDKPLLNGVNTHFDKSKPFGKVIKSENYFSPNLEQFL